MSLWCCKAQPDEASVTLVKLKRNGSVALYIDGVYRLWDWHSHPQHATRVVKEILHTLIGTQTCRAIEIETLDECGGAWPERLTELLAKSRPMEWTE